MRYTFYQIVILIALFLSYSSCKVNDESEDETNEIIDPNTIASDNLIVYFPFEGNAIDLIEGLKPVEEINVAYIGGKTGKAYKGINSGYLLYNIPNTSRLHLLESGFTIASWIKGPKVTQTPYPQIMGITEADFSTGKKIIWQQQVFPISEQGMFFQWSFAGVDTTYWVNKNRKDSVNIKFTSDTWIHIIMTCDPVCKTVNIYKDGDRLKNLTDTIASMNLDFQYSGKLFIGSSLAVEKTDSLVKEWIGCFEGSLDEFRIYNKGLTEEEAKLLYKAEKSQIN